MFWKEGRESTVMQSTLAHLTTARDLAACVTAQQCLLPPLSHCALISIRKYSTQVSNMFGQVAQPVWRLAMGWTVRLSNPGGGEIFRTCPDWTWGPTSLLYNGYRVFPGGKERPGRDADPSSPSSAVVMKG